MANYSPMTQQKPPANSLVVPVAPGALERPLATTTSERAERYFEAAKGGENTRRAYAGDWQAFVTWCAAHGRTSLPATPETVVGFLADDAEHHKLATVRRRTSAIARAHRLKGFAPPPTSSEPVRALLRGMTRVKGTRQEKKRPLLLADLQAIIPALHTDFEGVRDRAVLLLGFACAMRRSEIAALDVGDLAFEARGLAVLIQKSKNDQSARGRYVAVLQGSNPATCPVRAVKAWLARFQIATKPVDGTALFRRFERRVLTNDRMPPWTVALIVKDAVAAIGKDPKPYGGHSLRAGFVTEGRRRGLSDEALMAQTGHKKIDIFRGYDRPEDAFANSVSGKLGL